MHANVENALFLDRTNPMKTHNERSNKPPITEEKFPKKQLRLLPNFLIVHVEVNPRRRKKQRTMISQKITRKRTEKFKSLVRTPALGMGSWKDC